MVLIGQFPSPRHTIAHLSDPHLRSAGDTLYRGAVRPEDGLISTLERLARLDPLPQALVLTGDLADRGEPGAYRRLREIVEPAAAAMGAVVVWVMGNHDERTAYARELFDRDDGGPQDRVHHVAGLRIIALDTSVPGYHHGDLAPEQLEWLTEVLREPAEHGTLLAMHHPPIPSPMVEACEIIALQDQDRLAPALAGSDVRSIMAGHFHFSTYSTYAGIGVSVASASCYTMDPAPLDRLISGVDAHQAFTMMHLYDDRVVHTVVPIGSAVEVTGAPMASREPFEALTALERREMFSRKDSDFNRASEGGSSTFPRASLRDRSQAGSGLDRADTGHRVDMTDDKAATARAGLLDAVTGKAKEVAGAVTGRGDLVEEGQLQQAEAARRKAAVADDALAQAEREEAARELREAEASAAAEQASARVRAETTESKLEQQRTTEHAQADRQAREVEAAGRQRAEAQAEDVAETGLSEAEQLAAGADRLEKEADAEQARLEAQADAAEQQAEALRAQAEK